MSTPGPAAEFLGKIIYEWTFLQPLVPTYLHLLLSALFAIYTGTHASLSRPKSARKMQSSPDAEKEEAEEEDMSVEVDQQMEGLSPTDAIVFPVLAGCMLGALYFLMKWLEDPAILSTFLNWYLSLYGVLSITKLFADSVRTLTSFIFPARYSHNGSIWEVNQQKRKMMPRNQGASNQESQLDRSSPLPGLFTRIPLLKSTENALWVIRDLLLQPVYIMEFYVVNVLEVKVPIAPQDILGVFAALGAVLYFNLVDKPWWLTNILGISFCYSTLQLMSPTTSWTGTLILISLFFYDIYFVFFTPLMITVATNLDIPVKLLFPRPSTADEDPVKTALSMLGLGDIVIPGMMIGFALRFDLYLFYLRKQTQRLQAPKEIPEQDLLNGKMTHPKETDGGVIKPTYQAATGGWGERFWLTPEDRASMVGGVFPKHYFYASIIGYAAGILVTLGVMQVYHHGQPALLYLVPGVLGSLWGTALVKGDIKTLWEYTEEDDKVESEGKAKSETNTERIGNTGVNTADIDGLRMAESNNHLLNGEGKSNITQRESKTNSAKRVVYFSISIPSRSAHLH